MLCHFVPLNHEIARHALLCCITSLNSAYTRASGLVHVISCRDSGQDWPHSLQRLCCMEMGALPHGSNMVKHGQTTFILRANPRQPEIWLSSFQSISVYFSLSDITWHRLTSQATTSCQRCCAAKDFGWKVRTGRDTLQPGSLAACKMQVDHGGSGCTGMDKSCTNHIKSH